MINLTPHDITIWAGDGTATTIPPSGAVARVIHSETESGYLQLIDDQGDGQWGCGKAVPVINRVVAGITGLPADADEPVLVSSMVLEALQQIGGYEEYPAYAPDTGKTAIRNEKGHIVMVTRLVSLDAWYHPRQVSLGGDSND